MAADPVTPLPPARAWALVLVATATMAVAYVDRQAVAVLAPTITKELAIGEAAFGWLASAFSIAYLLSAPFAGRWIERVGARYGLLASVSVWSVVAAIHALVPGFGTLFALRIALGVAEAPSFPGAAESVTRALPPHQRSTGYGILFTGSSLGAALSAVLAPALMTFVGWRGALVGTAIVGLAWLPLWVAVTASAAAQAALAPTPPAGPTPPITAVLRRRAVRRTMIAVVASAPTTGFLLQWGAKVLVARHGLRTEDVGHYLWLPPLGFDAGAVVFGALAARLSPRALFLGAAGLLAVIAALGSTASPWATTLLAASALAGGGALYSLGTTEMMRTVRPDEVPVAGSFASTGQSLALVVAFPLIGAVVERTHDYALVGYGLAAWAAPGVLFYLLDSRADDHR